MSVAIRVGLAVWLFVGGIYHVHAQYDFPIDSCACHIHYEIWVQLQHQLSVQLTDDFPERLLHPRDNLANYLAAQDCPDPRGVKNILDFTLGPAYTDCAPGHVAQFILCSQLWLSRGDLGGALRYFEFANFVFPLALSCMDQAIWTITPEAFYSRFRALTFAAQSREGDGASSPLSAEEIRSLAWRPATKADVATYSTATRAQHREATASSIMMTTSYLVLTITVTVIRRRAVARTRTMLAAAKRTSRVLDGDGNQQATTIDDGQ